MRCREGGRKLSVDTADCVDREIREVDNGGRDNNRNQRSRNLVGDFRPEQHLSLIHIGIDLTDDGAVRVKAF